MTDPALSLRRSIAGRRGAQSRWGMANRGSDQGQRPARAGGDPGFRMANAATSGGTAVIDLYGEIGFWGVEASVFVPQLREITADKIELHISSPGGDAWDGIAMFDALIAHGAEVEVHIPAIAASIATVIALAGDTVKIGANAQMMIHDAWGYASGNAAEMRHMGDLLDRASDNIASIYAARCGGTVRQWRAAMQAGVDGTWYTADEAVEAGLADEVVRVGKRGEDMEANVRDVWTHSIAARMRARVHALEVETDDPADPPADVDPVDPVPVGETGPEPVDLPAGTPVVEDPAPPVDADPGPDLADLVAGIDLSGLGDTLAHAIETADQEQFRVDPDMFAHSIATVIENRPEDTRPPATPEPQDPTVEDGWSGLANALKEGLFSQ